ncbi:MAG: nickel insertion protein, partial [Natronomonas sp.]
MRTLAFDGRTGASGDMILATLIATGADPDVLEPVEASLGIEYRIGETVKNGIRATTVDVLFDEVGRDRVASGSSIEESDRYSHEYDETHEHGHSHSHDETHEH